MAGHNRIETARAGDATPSSRTARRTHHPLREAPVPVSDPQPGANSPEFRPHKHSVHRYNTDSRDCPECQALATAKKAKFRALRRSERVLDTNLDSPSYGRLIHPALAPVDSDRTPRHGTQYGTCTYGCQCEPCLQSRRKHGSWCVGLLTAPSFGHHASWAALGAALLVALLVWRARITYYASLAHMFPSKSTLAQLSTAHAFAVAVVSLLAAFLWPARPGKHTLLRSPRQWVMRRV